MQFLNLKRKRMGGGRKRGLGKPPCSNQLEFPIESPGRAEFLSREAPSQLSPHRHVYVMDRQYLGLRFQEGAGQSWNGSLASCSPGHTVFTSSLMLLFSRAQCFPPGLFGCSPLFLITVRGLARPGTGSLEGHLNTQAGV